MKHFEGLRVDILCTKLSYICFIRILDGDYWVIVDRAILGRSINKVENH